MAELSNPNGNARPRRKCTRSKRIDENYVMTKISNPTRSVKRRKQLKKPLLQVDIVSDKSKRPPNLCVTQPNNSDNNCEVIIEISSDEEDNNRDNNLILDRPTAEYLYLNKFRYIKMPQNYGIFPGYNERVFLDLRLFLNKKNLTDFVNRDSGITTINDLFRVFIPNSWFNDVIIQQYFKILRSNTDNVFVLDTFFFESIEKYGFNGFIERFIKDINLIEFHKILVPTHVKNHWILLVVEMNQLKIVYYDSLDYFDYLYPKIKILKNFINEEYIKKNKKNCSLKDLVTDICSGMSPKQTNMSDCGVFACTNARYNVNNQPLTFSQDDIPLIRHRIMHELIYNKLLPAE